MLIGFGGFVGAAGLFLDVLTLLFVFLLLRFVIFEHLFRGWIFSAENANQVLSEFGGVQFYARSLVIGPLVVGTGLVHYGRGVGAVRCDGYDRQEHRHNRGDHANRLAHRVGLMSLVVDLKFSHKIFVL